MSAAIFIGDMPSEKYWHFVQVPVWLATTLRFLLSGLLLSAFSARAEAPTPSQEFWNYFVEFSDVHGELFDPSDYAAVANIPVKAQQKIESEKKEVENASAVKRLEQAPSENSSVRESSQ